MSDTVIWTPTAEQELPAVWLTSNSRSLVTQVAHLIEQRLRLDPLAIGESRASSINRVLFVAPFVVGYDVVEDDKAVFIRVVATTP